MLNKREREVYGGRVGGLGELDGPGEGKKELSAARFLAGRWVYFCFNSRRSEERGGVWTDGLGVQDGD